MNGTATHVAPQPTPSTLGKPRILCLHGGGVSAEIFQIQMRPLSRALAPYFRLVFPSGPFDCEMHDDLKPYYEGFTGCKRWSRWRPEDPPIPNALAISHIERCLILAMDSDEGVGEWVGLLGFSQGAKVAASILRDIQLRRDEQDRQGIDGMYGGLDLHNLPVGFAGARWRFAILMAGRPPFISLSDLSKGDPEYIGAGEDFNERERALNGMREPLCLPTLHVHGLLDPGLDLHRKLLTDYCDPTTVKLIEWNAAHRVPFKQPDVKVVSEGILELAKVRYDLPCVYLSSCSRADLFQDCRHRFEYLRPLPTSLNTVSMKRH